MSLATTLRESKSDWISRRPRLVLILSGVFILLIGIAIGSSWANSRAINKEVAEARGDFNWQLRHQAGSSAPTAAITTKPKDCN